MSLLNHKRGVGFDFRGKYSDEKPTRTNTVMDSMTNFLSQQHD